MQSPKSRSRPASASGFPEPIRRDPARAVKLGSRRNSLRPDCWMVCVDGRTCCCIRFDPLRTRRAPLRWHVGRCGRQCDFATTVPRLCADTYHRFPACRTRPCGSTVASKRSNAPVVRASESDSTRRIRDPLSVRVKGREDPALVPSCRVMGPTLWWDGNQCKHTIPCRNRRIRRLHVSFSSVSRLRNRAKATLDCLRKLR